MEQERAARSAAMARVEGIQETLRTDLEEEAYRSVKAAFATRRPGSTPVEEARDALTRLIDELGVRHLSVACARMEVLLLLRRRLLREEEETAEEEEENQLLTPLVARVAAMRQEAPADTMSLRMRRRRRPTMQSDSKRHTLQRKKKK